METRFNKEDLEKLMAGSDIDKLEVKTEDGKRIEFKELIITQNFDMKNKENIKRGGMFG